MSTQDKLKVLVIGGGNCGLAIATGLKKVGIEYTIFERDEDHDYKDRPRDWGMLLHWGQEHLEKLLPADLKARIKEPRVNPAYEMIQPIPHINDDKSVVIDFEDGTQASGNIVVGCDGSHSRVREFLVGMEAAKMEDLPLTIVNYASASYTAEQARQLTAYHPIVKLAKLPELDGGALLAALDTSSPDPSQWRFQNYASWWGPPDASDLADPKVRLTFYQSLLSQFCEPFRTAALAGTIADDTILPIYRGGQWAPTMDWDNHGGRVTLAGDAAHSMLPHRGQGLNQAMADARYLVEAVSSAAMGTTTLAQAINAYETEMKPRGAKEVALSYEQARMGRSHDSWKVSPVAKLGLAKAKV